MYLQREKIILHNIFLIFCVQKGHKKKSFLNHIRTQFCDRHRTKISLSRLFLDLRDVSHYSWPWRTSETTGDGLIWPKINRQTCVDLFRHPISYSRKFTGKCSKKCCPNLLKIVISMREQSRKFNSGLVLSQNQFFSSLISFSINCFNFLAPETLMNHFNLVNEFLSCQIGLAKNVAIVAKAWLFSPLLTYCLYTLPLVANADKIQNEQTKEWSDKEAWEAPALAFMGLVLPVLEKVGVEGLQTRTKSLAITSVASRSKKVLKAEGRHKVRAASNSRWMAKMLPRTVGSLHSYKVKENYCKINFESNARPNMNNYSKSILTLAFVKYFAQFPVIFHWLRSFLRPHTRRWFEIARKCLSFHFKNLFEFSRKKW